MINSLMFNHDNNREMNANNNLQGHDYLNDTDAINSLSHVLWLCIVGEPCLCDAVKCEMSIGAHRSINKHICDLVFTCIYG